LQLIIIIIIIIIIIKTIADLKFDFLAIFRKNDTFA
jgi:hypothetical protein